MNIANQITLYRIILALLFMVFMSIKGLGYLYTGFVLFVVAAISDLYDGKIARRTDSVTDFGKIMDPLADKLLITSALVILVQESVIPAWMVILIIGREFAVMGLRVIASKGDKIIEADQSGKYKTTAQLTAIIIILVFILFKKTMIYLYAKSIKEILISAGELGEIVLMLLNSSPYYLMLIAVIITITSGINYFVNNKKFFMKEY